MSPTSFVPGVSEVKSLPMRSAKTLSGSEGMVVRLNARIRLATETHPIDRAAATAVEKDALDGPPVGDPADH